MMNNGRISWQPTIRLWITAKNELQLSESIVEKIAKQKALSCPRIKPSDFTIFCDPHITKSHGRIINIDDLKENQLYKESIISSINLSGSDGVDINLVKTLLFELYVRKKLLLDDMGNAQVKTIEYTNEIYAFAGRKRNDEQLNGDDKKKPE